MPTPLDNDAHHDLRVMPRFGEAFGDAVNQVLLLPTEFEDAQRDFPIFLRRDQAGRLQAVALLGLDRGENLFLGPDGWTSRHIPAVQQRGPFSIVLHQHDGGREPAIHINLDDPRVGRDQGHPLFMPHGGQAPYLQEMTRTLHRLWQGTELSGPLYSAWEAAGLVEPVAITVTLDDDRDYALSNFLTINAERLAGLDGATLERLNRAGFLRQAYLILASLGNVARLIALKNEKGRSDERA